MTRIVIFIGNSSRFLDAVILQFEALILRKDYTNGIKYGHLETELFDLEERISQILKSL